jgi:hypothetical protein
MFKLFLGEGTFFRIIVSAVKMCHIDKTYPMIREIFPLNGIDHGIPLKKFLPLGICASYFFGKVFRPGNTGPTPFF